jgi:hypothetical protein
MSDLVARLRTRTKYHSRGDYVEVDPDCTEAADMIERLTRERDSARDEAERMRRTRDAEITRLTREHQAERDAQTVITNGLLHEIERLRAKLERLCNAADDVGMRHFDHDSIPASVVEMQQATLAAREALRGAG